MLQSGSLYKELFGLRHTEVQVTNDDALNAVQSWLEALDLPSLDGLNVYVISAAVRKKINRPVGIMDNHSQYYPWHDDDGFLDHFDALYMEREAGAMFRPELTLRNWMKRNRW